MNDRTGGRVFRPGDHPLVQLTLVRMREFLREPEAVFWTLLFPIVLSCGLGLAFKERPESVLKIAAPEPLAQTLRAERGLDVIALGTPDELMASVPMPPKEPRVHAATLEDVFVALTGRHLRDE